MLLNTLDKTKKTVVALGKFDGVHIGHKKLIECAADTAREKGLLSLIYVICPADSDRIMKEKDKIEIIKNYGADIYYRENVTTDFMSMSAVEFVTEILKKKLNCVHVIAGYNFRFAKNRSADAKELKRLCRENKMECSIIGKVTCVGSDGAEHKVSSSRICSLIEKGDVSEAAKYLGRPYFLSGTVICGRQIGRSLDFPTANITYGGLKPILKSGVYVTNTYISGKKYPSVTNVGTNPTVSSDGNISVETNIIDFFENIYGKDIRVEFIKKIRGEIKFASVGELKCQIAKDKQSAEMYFKELSENS